jgi:hypothetical protein
MALDLSRLPAADREATVRSEILAVISGYGGEQIIAGPPMERMTGELTALVLGWLEPAPVT